VVVVVGALVLGLFVRPVQAEWYVAGQVGVNFPKFSDVEWSAGGSSVAVSEVKLQTSIVYGGKVGYNFDSVKWLGIETEVFNATPHVSKQDLTSRGITLGTISGISNRVLTWVPVNLIVKYQAGLFEPYAGVGLGVFFSHLSAPGFSSSSTDVGLNTLVGLRFHFAHAIIPFVEWKYNRANVSHGNLAGTGLNLEGNYEAHNLVGGIGYHF
jgi:opacity protein-like surface antigen